MTGRKIIQETVKSIVDGETGELKEKESTAVYRLPSEPDYVKMYMKDLMYLVGLPKHYMGVLLWMLSNMTYASEKYGMCIVLSPILKEDIKNELGLKNRRTIDVILSGLKKRGVIEYIGRFTYRLNPYLFGRGNWKDIVELRENCGIKLEVLYTKDEKTIKASVKELE